MDPLVTAEALARLLEAGTAVAADVRWYLDGRSGRAAYEQGHIPGAVFVDVDGVLAAPPGDGPGRHPLPRPEAFAAALCELGIGDGDFVVAYDDAAGSIAARLWWMLHVTGHRAAVLDGGIGAWNGNLETGPAAPRPRREFSVTAWPQQASVDADDVAKALADGAAVLDARAAERYRGEVEPIDARAGHIPGAVSAPWSMNVDASGRFLPRSELRDRYRDLGVRSGAAVIAYCGSGVTACHDLLALEIAGIEGARLYEGSWSNWSSDQARPVATGND